MDLPNPQTDQIISPWKEFTTGVAATIPLVVGAIPFGIIFGALASTAGLSVRGTQAMSLFVFAGSAQFIAAGLIANGTSLLVIVITTLVVNLRHMLYGATLAPHLKFLPQRWLVPLGFWLTDESFVVVIERFQKSDQAQNKHWFFLGSAVFMYTNWQLCTFIGILTGQRIDDPLKWGVDFAMIVTFIGMLIPMIRNKTIAAAAFASGAAALLLRRMPNQLGLILAALIGVSAGILANYLIINRKEGTNVS